MLFVLSYKDNEIGPHVTSLYKQVKWRVWTFGVLTLSANSALDCWVVQEIDVKARRKERRRVLTQVIRISIAYSWDEEVDDLNQPRW